MSRGNITGNTLNILRTSTSLHFMLAIAVSFILSVSLATAASMTGLMPDARVDPQKSAFRKPLTDHPRSAARDQSATPAQASAASPRAGQ